jgi:hypothetical protein
MWVYKVLDLVLMVVNFMFYFIGMIAHFLPFNEIEVHGLMMEGIAFFI